MLNEPVAAAEFEELLIVIAPEFPDDATDSENATLLVEELSTVVFE